MNKLLAFTLIGALLFSSWGARAAAAESVIDFEGLAPLVAGKDSLYLSSYSEDGFSFTSSVDPLLADTAFSVWGPAGENYSGSTALFNTYDTALTILRRADGTPFSLLSIDLSPAFADPGSPGSVLFLGRHSDNSAVTQEFQFGPGNAPVTHILGPGFSDLVEVRWEQAAPWHQFDNVRVASVPEPAALALMLFGLLMLAVWRPGRAAHR
jgi:hypothetical protein